MRNILLAIVLVGVVMGFRPFKIMAEHFVQQGIAVSRCSLVGHSEGARTAAIAASKRPDVGFLVRLAGSALAAIKDGSSDDTLMETARSLVAAQLGAPPEAQRKPQGDGAAFAAGLVKQTLGQLESRWMRFFVGFDPSPALRRVACPVFAAFGSLDVQVSEADNRMRLDDGASVPRRSVPECGGDKQQTGLRRRNQG